MPATGSPSPVSQEVITSLAEATEGWITGLHLAALNLRHAADPTAFMSGLQDADRYTTDYLVEEVLSREPPGLQEFLLKTSILDRLSGSLCEAVTGLVDLVSHGQAYLEWKSMPGSRSLPSITWAV